MSAVRLTVFPSDPEFLLIWWPEKGPLRIPILSTPFDKSSIAQAFVEAGIETRIIESRPGRWTASFKMARAAEKAERHQRQKLQESTEAVFLKTSSDDVVRERAELIERKHEVDDVIRKLKVEIGTAKNAVAMRGVYMPPDQFRALETRLAKKQTESLAIQGRLGELKKAVRDRNVTENTSWERRFVAAARDLLDAETFEMLRDEADHGREALREEGTSVE